MSDRPVKRSLTLHGHRTSVSLETPFWEALQDIAAARGMSLAKIAAEIDDTRGTGSGLATALRLYVLAYYRRPTDEPIQSTE
ncbi:ribbon-helix-helix domain-containing protein [Falsigemmobacter faecalis]|uniref:Aryl-sulfate sulfotransferase n=1 Tax=Falsigemmobacter faecalis TaxID=2488730 RepID=A0A3P3DD55_9RHOB|nr:ribbon-helix-helix domain-containing protein [Falsigemmobacter faecalis]RRH72210.1 aryl-sulfate sulfotransferase [Falsigemmobacter faecalis]